MIDYTADDLRDVPNASGVFGRVPNGAEAFRNIPNNAERFGRMPNASERTEQHTLTVREVARLFENQEVPRTERSIINWCQLNRQGIARLDAFYDTNERKYFVTPQSVTLAIKEEQAKQSATGDVPVTESKKEVPEEPNRSERISEADEEIESLRLKIRDLEITNRVKDQVIGMAEKERERLMMERETYVRELMAQNYRLGSLDSEIRRLNGLTGPAIQDQQQ